MSETSANALSMFGELEDAPEGRMVVRATGHLLGTSAGWCHYAGLAVVFPQFQTDHLKLAKLIDGIDPKRVCLGIDFYTGEVKIIEGNDPTDGKPVVPIVHHALQLHELLNP